MATRADITPELCRQLLRYDPETGKLYWLPRPRELFASDRSFTMWHTRYAGKEAFTADDGRGYKNGAILYATHLAHRVIWAIARGEWPAEAIDHINGNRSDNRLANLRQATTAENQRNRGVPANNSSGAMGVSWSIRKGCWQAKLNSGGKTVWLGYFDRLDQAVEARRMEQHKRGFSPAHGRRAAHKRGT